MQMATSRKVFDAIAVADPAINWARMMAPPLVTKACPECVDGTRCDTCGGTREVRTLAWEPLDMGSYRLLREPDDKKHARLVCFDGERPVLYKYRRLTRPQIQKWISTAGNDTDRQFLAFRAGLVEIHRPGVEVYKCRWPGRGALVMDEDELGVLEDEHGLDWSTQVDIGDQILSRSDVPLDCLPSWRVPQPLVHVWVAAFLRSAERNQSAALSTSGALSTG